MRRLSRPAGLLVAGVAAVAVAGCGAGTADRAAPAPHAASPAAATSSVGSSPALAAGLLPAGAFASGTTVTPVPAAELTEATLAGALGGVQITPSGCADAVQQVAGQLSSVTGTAGELAEGSDTWTAELLATTAPQVDAAHLLGGLVSACSSATVTVPQRGTATVGATSIMPAGLPDGASAVAVTVTAQPAGASAFTASGLVGLVQAGDRLLLLGQASPSGAAPDQAAFAALLSQAAARAR